MNESKFSILDYASSQNPVHSLPAAQESLAGGQTQGDFEQCVDFIRSELAFWRGRTEEEQQRYSEMLNKAVLGYDTERRQMLAIIEDLLAKRRITAIPSPGQRFDTLSEAVFAEVIGMNVLELIMKNRAGLEEIQVVGRLIYEVRDGYPSLSPYQLSSVKELERIQQNLVLYNNESLNTRKRWAEVMLIDGSRVTMTGFGFTAEPTLTIRLFNVKHFSLQALARPEQDTIDEKVGAVILCILRSYFNMVIIGPTNSGKTNLIKAFIAELPDEERIVTIENRYELMLKRDFPLKKYRGVRGG